MPIPEVCLEDARTKTGDVGPLCDLCEKREAVLYLGRRVLCGSCYREQRAIAGPAEV
jgi:hypothetical protein